MPMLRLSRTTHGPVFESRNRGSSLREFGIAATAARHAIAMSRKKHAGPALRAVRPLPGDPVAVDLVELPLEAHGALLFLRFRHHFASFFLPSGFFSAFFSSFFSSFFSAGFFSSLAAALFSSFGAAFSGFVSGFASAFGASAFGAGAEGFSVFSALGGGVGFSGLGAASFLTSGSISFLRTRMCLRSAASASSFDLYTFASPTVS